MLLLLLTLGHDDGTASPTPRDAAVWLPAEEFFALPDPRGFPGSVEYQVDWGDGPDRYLISQRELPLAGWRRCVCVCVCEVCACVVCCKFFSVDVVAAKASTLYPPCLCVNC